MRYSKEMIDFLRDVSNKNSVENITIEFNKKFNLEKSKDAISGVMKRNKIKTLNETKFIKGHNPWNKNKKIQLISSSKFKKGHKINCREVGEERINKDGYVEIKVSQPNNWKLKHRYIYEKVFGEIPPNKNVIFADGNKQNFSVENLVLVSKEENILLKKYRVGKPEFVKVGLTLIKLKKVLREKTNERT